MGGGDHSLHISAPQLLPFGIDSVLKILNERITQLMNQSMNDKGVFRTGSVKHIISLEAIISQQTVFFNQSFQSGHCT